MIFKTIYTCTIDDFGLAFQKPDIINNMPFPLPEKWVLKAFNKLVAKYNDVTKGDDTSKLGDKYQITRFECKIESLILIYKVLSTAWLGVEISKDIFELYKDEFGRDFDLKEYGKELENIIDRVQRYKDGLDALIKAMNENKMPSFINFAIIIDDWLDMKGNLGNKMLYMMPEYIKKANIKMKQNENKK